MSDEHTSVEYRDIPGFPGYRVGSDGSVWFRWITCRSGRRLTNNWKRMKLTPGSKGYLRVNLTPESGGRYQTFRVHRLVLEAFVGPCPDGMECRHFPDTDKTNNRLENLSWGTPEQNRDDNHQTDAYRDCDAHPMAKLTSGQVASIRSRYAAGGVLQRELAEEFGVSVPNISTIVNGHSW